jgi:hypothetical protein
MAIGESTYVEIPARHAVGPSTEPVREPPGRWLVRHRYLVLSTVVIALVSIQTANGQWSTDMWEHVTVVRGLIDDPFHVTHPLALLDTPYTVALGFLGHVSGVSAVTMLSLAAIGNVVLLLIGLRLFVIEATRNRRAPFWALVFVLLLWGVSPYRFSGFFSLNSIGFVLPYPSAFATAIALLTLTAALRATEHRSWQLFAAVVAGTGSVVLVHPITGSWLAIGLVAVGISRARDIRDWVWLLTAGALGFALTFLWPYYSVLDLLRDTGSYDRANAAMYRGVVPRLFPAAIGIWVIWRRFRLDRRDLLSVMLVGGLALYLYGYVRNQYSYGRSLAFIVLILDIAAADGVARLERGFRWRRSSQWLRAGAVALTALLVVGLVESRGGLLRMVPMRLLPASIRTSEELVRPDDEYSFLSRYVDGGQVVIGATDQDNRVIPAIAGQPLRPFWMAPVVRDISSRTSAEAEFLDPATPAARRAEIQSRYNARFVLVHKRNPAVTSLLRQLQASGARIVYDRHGFELLELSPSSSS